MAFKTYFFIKEIKLKKTEVGKALEKDKPIPVFGIFSIQGVTQRISM